MGLLKNQLLIFWGFVCFFLLCLLVGIKTESYYLALLPLLFVAVVATLSDYKFIYFALLAVLPMSVEYYFPNGLATDLPSEPMMVGLLFFTIILLSRNVKLLPSNFINHPITILLIVHVMWYGLTMINSENPVISFKILLAKLWYIVPFAFLTAIVFGQKNEIKKLFWLIFIPLTIEIIITNIRHSVLYGFSFEHINKCVTPYFRNHVNYAAMMSVFYPFIWLAATWYEKNTWQRKLLNFMKVFYVFAIYFSFTRTAMLALLMMIPFYYIVKWRMTNFVVLSTLTISLFAGLFLFYDNNYLKFAPDFQNTVYHNDDFSDHLSSTFEGSDVSSMERVYRWVAAIQMTPDRPLMGVGAGNFYDFYKKYAVSSFETYISDNEERSTVHNYFLLLLCEQGIIGLGIFILLAVVIFLYGQKTYNQLQKSSNKNLIMTLLLVMLSIYVNLLLSDMMESDKVGPFFFITATLIVLVNRRKLLMEAEGEQS